MGRAGKKNAKMNGKGAIVGCGLNKKKNTYPVALV
jgi:hypothetical protein